MTFHVPQSFAEPRVETSELGQGLLTVLARFFARLYPDCEIPLHLLLGVSGGPDSTALWHLLRDLRSRRRLRLTCVHIDHRWRPESSREADELQRRFAAVGEELRVIALDGDFGRGNLEARGRQQRLEIFSQVAVEVSASALVLAHHAGDRVEGMLKRVFEGSELAQLRALVSDQRVGPLRILRPLLEIEKGDLVSLLNERGEEFFSDPTNLNPKFWRGYVRSQLLPMTSSALGKQLRQPLRRIADHAAELHEFLDWWWRCCAPHLIKPGFLGTWISDLREIPALLIRHIVRKIAERQGIHLPIAIARNIAAELSTGRANVGVGGGSLTAICDRGQLFVLSQRDSGPSRPRSSVIARAGCFQLGRWTIRASRATAAIAQRRERSNLDWRRVWSGEFEGWIPADAPLLALADGGMAIAGRHQSLFTWWGKRRVPAFLRAEVPVAVGPEGAICQWLSSEPLNRRLRSNSPPDAKGWLVRFYASNG